MKSKYLIALCALLITAVFGLMPLAQALPNKWELLWHGIELRHPIIVQSLLDQGFTTTSIEGHRATPFMTPVKMK